jgi:alginate O-acetyltransferase complex protein AlgI
VMLLGGLWHGAAWRFVIWGGIHGLGLAVERVWLGRNADRLRPGVAVVRWLITFHIVCIAWIFFRAKKLDLATSMIWRLFAGWGDPTALITPLLVVTIVLMLAAQFVPERVMEVAQVRASHLPVVAQGLGLAFCFFLIQQLAPIGVQPFIYFQF